MDVAEADRQVGMHKRVASVAPVILGDATTTDLLADDTEIPLENAVDFAEDGGYVRILGEVYTYTLTDDGEESGTPLITLDSGLVDDVPAETPVELWNPDHADVMVDWKVDVTDDTDGSAGVATLTHSLIPFMAEGLPLNRGDSVTVREDSDKSWMVTEIHGRDAVLNSDVVTDITAPSESPVITPIGLLETFLLRTTSVGPRTHLTYEVSTDYDPLDPGAATWDPLPDMPVFSTIIEAKALPDESPFEMGVDYTFRVIAGNDAGDAEASAAVTVQLNSSAAEVIAQLVVTAELNADRALLGQLSIGGDNFTLTPVGRDPENPAGGLLIRTPDGDTHFPADGTTRPRIHGDVYTETLEIRDGAKIFGDSNLSGNISMDATIPDPDVAATGSNTYEALTTDVTPAASGALCRNVADDGWVIATTGEGLVEVDDNGDRTGGDYLYPYKQVTKIGSYYYVTQANGLALVSIISAAFGYTNYIHLNSNTDVINAGDVIGTDGTYLLVARDVGGDYEITRYNVATGAIHDTLGGLASPVGDIGAVYRGGADFPAHRYVVQPKGGSSRVFTTAGTRQNAEEWNRPQGLDVHGMWFDGSNFWVIDGSGTLRKLEPIATSPAGDWWWKYVWQDDHATPHTTNVSPAYGFTRKARAQMKVTASAAPGSGEAPHVADRVAIYASSTEFGVYRLQGGGQLAAGVRELTIAGAPDTGSAAAPSANTWGGVFTPAVLAADAGGFSIDGNSDGSIGTGTFADEIIALAGAGASAATETTAGVAEIATQTETNTGTDDARFVTPLKFATRLAAYAQPLDGDLTNIAALTTSSYGRALLELANQAALMGLIPSASITVEGKVELATGTETTTGSDTTRAVTPAGLKVVTDTLQPLDADLTAIAGLSTTSYGRALLELANQAALAALIPTATEAVKGMLEVASTAQTNAGTSDTKIITPLKLQEKLAAYAHAHATTLANATGTSETAVASWTIPAGYLTAGMLLRLAWFGQTNGTATLQYRVRCGPAATAVASRALLGTWATSAAGAANQHSTGDIMVSVVTAGGSGTATAVGRMTLQAATLANLVAAAVTGVVDTTVENVLSLTVVQSAVNTLTSRGASLIRA